MPADTHLDVCPTVLIPAINKPMIVSTPPQPVARVFDWKLAKTAWTKSIFTKRKMKERVNISLIYGFIKAEMGIAYQGCSRYDGIPCEIKTELDQIRIMRDQYDKKEKYVKMAHCLPKHKWGRTMPIGYASLSVFHRPTRHRLCEQEYIDLDIQNCQPQVLVEICKQRGIQVDNLSGYCADPKGWRQKIAEYHDCDKDIAKQLFVRLMFGGSYTQWIIDSDIQKNEGSLHPFVLTIEKELTGIIDAVYQNNQHIVKDVLKCCKGKWVTESQKRRGCMALWAQTLERRIMEDSVMWLHENKSFTIEDIVPCQDGLMILKDLYYDRICEDLQTNIAERYGFSIRWCVKPFDEAIDIPEYEGGVSFDEWFDSLSSKRLAQHLVLMRGSHIINNNEGVYIYYKGRWYDETSEKNRNCLTLMVGEDLYEDRKAVIEELVDLSPEEITSLLKTLRTNTSNGSIFKDIVRHVLAEQAGKSEGLKFNEKIELLGFTNGVMELPTKTFRQYRFDDYITLNTGYEYIPPDYSDRQVLARRLDLLLLMRTIQEKPDHLRLLYQVLCSGLDGSVYEKFFFFNGKGGNGKGLVSGLMRGILSTTFCMTPKESIVKALKNEGATPDIADLQYKRYIIIPEMSGQVNNSAFKQLSSHDSFKGRQLYEKNKEFKLHCTTIGEFNSPPDFEEVITGGEERRSVNIGFNNNYTDDPEKIGKTIGGVYYRKANPYYTTPEFYSNNLPIFLDILLDKYVEFYDDSIQQIKYNIPKDILQATKQLLDGMSPFNKVIYNKYEQTTEKVERVAFKTLWDEVQHSEDYKILKAKVKRQYNRDKFYLWLRANFTTKEFSGGNGNFVMDIREKYREEEVLEVLEG